MSKNARGGFYNDIAQALSLGTQTPIVILSPHLDDAVWSIGPVLKELAEHGHKLTIITLFSLSVISGDDILPPAAGTPVRKAEDAVACQAVGCDDVVYLDFPDGILRDRSLETVFDPAYKTPEWLGGKLLAALTDVTPSQAVLFAPSGFGWHIDHQLTARLASQLPQRTIFYEDMPYASLTVKLQEAHEFLRHQGAQEARIPIGDDTIAEHLRLYRLYASQRDPRHEEQINQYLRARGYGFWL
jgi:LmbE family N-acetylglucosaminyl deacetylase